MLLYLTLHYHLVGTQSVIGSVTEYVYHKSLRLHCASISVSKYIHSLVFHLKCQSCIAVIKHNIHGSPKRPNIKIFIIEVGNHSEKKFADMDLRLAVVLFVAVVYLSTTAGMNCLNPPV